MKTYCLPEFLRSYLYSTRISCRRCVPCFHRVTPKVRVHPPSWNCYPQGIVGIDGPRPREDLGDEARCWIYRIMAYHLNSWSSAIVARLTTIVRLRKPYLFRSCSQHWMPVSAVKSFYFNRKAFPLFTLQTVSVWNVLRRGLTWRPYFCWVLWFECKYLVHISSREKSLGSFHIATFWAVL